MPTAPLPLLDELAACCAPPSSGGLDAAGAERLAAVLKVIAEPTRLRLLSLVAAHQDSEECICNLTDVVGLSQPTVSHHMAVLRDAGLVEAEKVGQWMWYRRNERALRELARALNDEV